MSKDETNMKKKQKKGRKLFIISQIVILGLVVLLLLLFLNSRVGKRIFGLRSEAISAVQESTIDDFRGNSMSTIYDADGEVLTVLKNQKNIQYLAFEEIPQTVKDAYISIEDKRFYEHNGVDFMAVVRASLSMISKKEITQGGSTITQQLSRNIFLTHEVSWQRKIKEMFIAWELEKLYSKDEILEFYINNIFYSNNCYGIEAASRKYFGKSIGDCSISETAFLCAIPNNPSHYDPLKHKDHTMARRDAILEAMCNNGKITQEEYETALKEEITVDSYPMPSYESTWESSYVIHCVAEELMALDGFKFQYEFDDLKDKLDYEEEYNAVYAEKRTVLFSGGYEIYTSIEPEKQQALQDTIDEYLEEFNTKNLNGSYALQSAAACIDNETGMVAAIVGGRTQDGISYDYNRAFLSHRQPGSTIKPLIVYAPALENGYAPDTIVEDKEIKDGPKNAGNSYAGRIPLRTAVEKSKNTVAWQLFEELTPEKGLSYLLEMEFTGIVPQDYTLSSALGGMENGASALEMASGYATLANEGSFRKPTCILKVEDSAGNAIIEPDRSEKEIYTRKAAHDMTNILEGVITRGTAAGKALKNQPTAGKTGTTDDNKDGWFIGFSQYYTTSVWVGYDQPRSMKDLTGSSYPAKIWHDYMEKIHEGLERGKLND
ncbi:MAG: transglycosylase domain-containing protein [Lachnospiraceae bacterium]